MCGQSLYKPTAGETWYKVPRPRQFGERARATRHCGENAAQQCAGKYCTDSERSGTATPTVCVESLSGLSPRMRLRVPTGRAPRPVPPHRIRVGTRGRYLRLMFRPTSCSGLAGRPAQQCALQPTSARAHRGDKTTFMSHTRAATSMSHWWTERCCLGGSGAVSESRHDPGAPTQR